MRQRAVAACAGHASRLALFRTSHTLARMVLLHAPGSKRLTVEGSKGWSGALPHLLGTRWQPLPLTDLELRIKSSLPPPPAAAISQHVSHLHLHQCIFTGQDLVAWQLHDAALWPHLQHLTATACSFNNPATTAMPQLQPIPHLRSFTWDASGTRPREYVAVLGLLAAHATHARLDLPRGEDAASVKVLQHLQRLTHCHVQEVGGGQVVQALLQHPMLEHVTMGLGEYGVLWPAVLTQQPCQWRTLTLPSGAFVCNLGRFPLANLERLTIGGLLSAFLSPEVQTAAGVALLQQLHSGGRLVVLPRPANDPLARQWQLQRGSALFALICDMPSNVMALLRLVLEAGQGIDTLQLTEQSLASTQMRAEVLSLLQHSGRIHTLCLSLEYAADEDWWSSLLGALPPCITHVKLDVSMVHPLAQVLTLVLSGRASLAHPLKLTLLHLDVTSPTLEAELLQLVAGGGGGGGGAGDGGGAGGASGVPFLTLEVVRY